MSFPLVYVTTLGLAGCVVWFLRPNQERPRILVRGKIIKGFNNMVEFTTEERKWVEITPALAHKFLKTGSIVTPDGIYALEEFSDFQVKYAGLEGIPCTDRTRLDEEMGKLLRE